MPSIAQQDYIHDLEFVDYENPTESERALIKKLVERGTIWDAIVYVGGNYSRVIAVNDVTENIVVYNTALGEAVPISYS